MELVRVSLQYRASDMKAVEIETLWTLFKQENSSYDKKNVVVDNYLLSVFPQLLCTRKIKLVLVCHRFT